MPKYRVLLRGRNVLMRDQETDNSQRAGFYVNCCVDAADRESAGTAALGILRRHPSYTRLVSWPAGGPSGPPTVEVASVDRVPWLSRRVAAGITAGFTFFVDADEQPKSETHR
jgi:hypothetical protein